MQEAGGEEYGVVDRGVVCVVVVVVKVGLKGRGWCGDGGCRWGTGARSGGRCGVHSVV